MQIANFQTGNQEYALVLRQALERLAEGKLVAMPTETVYGLAGDATNGKAVAKIFETKGRPQFNPLIAHVSDLEMAKSIGVFDEANGALAKQFWPGPLTLVVKTKPTSRVHDLVSAGLGTIAIRCPGGAARELIDKFGKPLAAPSANRSGHVSPTSVAHVVAEFGDADILVLDGGQCSVGLESTIVRVDKSSATILRAGAIDQAALAQCTGLEAKIAQCDAPISAPGMMTSHYAPDARVMLNCTDKSNDSALLAFGAGFEHADLNLSARGDLREAASNLYEFIRHLDSTGVKNICVTPIPHQGLGIAINDRLARAAAPRPESERM